MDGTTAWTPETPSSEEIKTLDVKRWREIFFSVSSVVKKQVFLTFSATYFPLVDHSTANAKGISSSGTISSTFLVYRCR